MDHIEQERQKWREKAREVAKNVVASRAAEIDIKGEFPWDIAEVFAKEGFLSLIIPKEFGGMESDITSFCIISEEISKYCASSALLIIAHTVGIMPIVLGERWELKGTYLTRLVKEKALACFCLTEPEAGSDSAAIRTKALLKDDHYLLNGRKCFITNGGVAEFYTIFAVTNPEKKMEGISGFFPSR